MSAAGAKAALQGFRLQALYTLAMVLRPRAEHLVFHPEGKEDLDIYAGADLRRVIQVKAHAAALSLSALGLGQDDSFLRRAAELDPRPELEVVVATFGPVGPELEGAWAGEAKHRGSVVAKLREQKFSDERIENLFASVRFEPVQEPALRTEVFDFLSESLLGGDPQSAFDLLVAWLYQAAEERRRITTADVRDRITRVGRYLAERAAHHQEWFTSIVPLEDAPLSAERREELASEYHRGVSARFDHIVAEQDVVREEKLRQIDEAFSGSKVVIIHGASGQGKSTLGLRYLHDFVPAAWRFSIRLVADRAHALRVATALAGHLRAVAAPMYVYLDVSPRDADWPDLVRVLAEQPDVKVLVTIREEDLARVSVSEAELGFPRAVQLQFEETEARQIYDKLVARRPADRFLSFPEAWAQFGGQGPLLEFTYLVTQSESLEATLRAQVRRLRDEVRRGDLPAADLAFLRLASVAGAYEARADVRGLAAAAGVADPARTLELLESEYLVRRSREGRYVEGLHPIRSAILAAELTDPAFAPWAESAVACIPHLPEPDLEAFLFHSFLHHPTDAEALLDSLSARRFRTWSGLAGVGRSLIWLGLKRYVESNLDVINEGLEKFGSGWSLLLDFDIADIVSDEKPFIERIQGAHPSVVELGRQLRDRQSDKREVFAPFATWIGNVPDAPEPPVSALDWIGLAELCFWSLRLQLEGRVIDAAWAVDLGPAVDTVPLPVLSRAIQAWSYGPPDRFQNHVGPHAARLISRYRQAMQVVSLEETEERLFAHFIVPLSVLTSMNQPAVSEEIGKPKDKLHDLTLERIDLLSQLSPGREQYGTKGYGHHNTLVPWMHDPTEKSGVLARYLHPDWGPALNGMFLNLADLPARPATWTSYVDAVMSVRQSVLVSLNQLRKGLSAHFRSDKPVRIISGHVDAKAWDRTKEALERTPKLPRSAVDEWGFGSEGRSRSKPDREDIGKTSAGGIQRALVNLALDQHRPLVDATREYFSPLSNFFRQANGPLALNGFLGRAQSEEQRERYLTVAAEQGLPTDSGFLSAYNFAEALRHLPAFQREFRERFAHLVGPRRLEKVEKEELETLKAAWSLWHAFIKQPERHWRAPEVKASQVFSDILEQLRGAIRTGFAALAAGGVQAEIRSEQVAWEESPALWLVVEVENPLRLHEAIKAVGDVLQESLGDIANQSPEQFAVDTAWQNILVVPTFGGANPAASIWRFRPYHFYAGNKLEENRYAGVPIPFPDSLSQQLEVKIQRDGLEGPVERLQAGIVELWSIVTHASDFLRLPDTVDDEGYEIIQTYLTGVAERISEGLDHAVDLWNDAFEDINRTDEWMDRPLLVELHAALIEESDILTPVEGYTPGDTMDLPTLKLWGDRLQAFLPILEAMRLARIADTRGIVEIEG
jgi:hypothetical protein